MNILTKLFESFLWWQILIYSSKLCLLVREDNLSKLNSVILKISLKTNPHSEFEFKIFMNELVSLRENISHGLDP